MPRVKTSGTSCVRSLTPGAFATVTGARRSKSFPDLPMITENGVPGFAMPEASLVLVGPAALPGAIVKCNNAEVRSAMGVGNPLGVLRGRVWRAPR